MPKKCCVPNCKGNYKGADRVSVFKFPKDETLRKFWMDKIPRKNFIPNDNAVVCANHFSESFITRLDSVTRPDGSVLTVKRDIPKLTKDAYPSIFPNCPSYLSETPVVVRKAPDQRWREAERRDEKSFSDWLEEDKIINFSEFSDGFKTQLPDDIWLCKFHNVTRTESKESASIATENTNPEERQYFSFYKIDDNPSNKPSFVSAVRVYSDMHVQVFTCSPQFVHIPNSALTWLFRKAAPPTLTNWTQFDTLLSHFSTNTHISVKNSDLKEGIKVFADGLQNLYSEDKGEEDNEVEDTTCRDKLLLLVEQLNLLTTSAKRYSTDTLLWAFHTYAVAPRAYSMLRNSVLTLPHPSYLRKLTSAFKVGSGLDENVHMEYLVQKCKLLKEEEKTVILMLEEIHVSTNLSYKEGKLEGSASNCAISEASTAQVFLISSVLSKNKDVVAIIPVKNLNADMLHDMLRNVLQMLHDIGYRVLCCISDNNRINRNAFTTFCDGKLQTYIQNPFQPSEKMFFFFDCVHIFKCIRNNWLAQSDTSDKSFYFPLLETSTNTDEIKAASFCHLRRLYAHEKDSAVKLAPALNAKALYPTSTEKQNVKLMLKVFEQKNIVALQHCKNIWKVDTSGTRYFLSTILKLWDIINVKHPLKCIRLRNDNCKPISSSEDHNITFMKSVILWLQKWQSLHSGKTRAGILSNETMTALVHTLTALVQLATYLLHDKHFRYVLLGKFQTDNLEFRFSQYRRMSGCNFHVSIQQLLESEKKLKLLSVLKLVSASKGTINLREITDPIEEKVSEKMASSDEEYKLFVHLLPEVDSITISDEQMKALVFVSGYAASKVVPLTTCLGCKNDLTLDKKLHVEASSSCYSYLSALERGGLTWPSERIICICAEIFKVFQLLISKKEQEQLFLTCSNQRKNLAKLSFQRISELGLFSGLCDECGRNLQQLTEKCCKPVINIFLNNYSKQFSDQASERNIARKIKTFSQRI